MPTHSTNIWPHRQRPRKVRRSRSHPARMLRGWRPPTTPPETMRARRRRDRFESRREADRPRHRARSMTGCGANAEAVARTTDPKKDRSTRPREPDASPGLLAATSAPASMASKRQTRSIGLRRPPKSSRADATGAAYVANWPQEAHLGPRTVGVASPRQSPTVRMPRRKQPYGPPRLLAQA